MQDETKTRTTRAAQMNFSNGYETREKKDLSVVGFENRFLWDGCYRRKFHKNFLFRLQKILSDEQQQTLL